MRGGGNEIKQLLTLGREIKKKEGRRGKGQMGRKGKGDGEGKWVREITSSYPFQLTLPLYILVIFYQLTYHMIVVNIWYIIQLKEVILFLNYKASYSFLFNNLKKKNHIQKAHFSWFKVSLWTPPVSICNYLGTYNLATSCKGKSKEYVRGLGIKWNQTIVT